METISFNEFKKLELKTGIIREVSRVEDTDKLYRLKVDIGTEEPIQLITGLVPYYSDEQLKGKQIVILVNLEPKEFKGEMSQGMLLCAEDGDKVALLKPDFEVPSGSSVN
ncbi:tRNA-binding protein [Candidatus Undinarchaeota archaeon]